MSWRVIQADVLAGLGQLEDGSVQTCVTSPPYYGLRDYGDPGQIGLEPTPDEYVARLVGVFREVRRVLRDDGTLWLNLGDSYQGSYIAQSRVDGRSDTLNAANPAMTHKDTRRVENGVKPKDLLGIPWECAKALRAPYYAGAIKAERDRVWLAATLDAEGSICGFTHERKDDGSTRTGIHVTITNTSERLLDEARRIWPTSRSEHENHGEGHYGARPSWRWIAHGAENKALLLRELYPYLIAKQEQARLAYAFCELSMDAKRLGHSPQRDAVREKRAWIVAALTRLNRGESVDVPTWIGEPRSVLEPGYYLRSDIIWAKPNPMPESVTDRPTKAHEYLFLLSKSRGYHFDADAIREDNEHPDRSGTNPRLAISTQPGNTFQGRNGRAIESNPDGRNKRSVWTVPTQPFPGAHFAVFPPKLIEPCVLAGSRPDDTVLDPFSGAGTTGVVACRHDRDYIGIELNATYAEMSRQRIRDDGPLLNVPAELVA